MLLGAALSARPLPTQGEDQLLQQLLQQCRDDADRALGALLQKAQRMAQPSSRQRRPPGWGHTARRRTEGSVSSVEDSDEDSPGACGSGGENDPSLAAESHESSSAQLEQDGVAQPQLLRASLAEARALRGKVQNLMVSSGSRSAEESHALQDSAQAFAKRRDAQKYWRLSFDTRKADQADVFVFDAASGNAGWARDTAKQSTGTAINIGPVLRAVDHRKRWMVRPIGDLKSDLVSGRSQDRRKHTSKHAPAPWIGAMETQRMSRSHRDHVTLSVSLCLSLSVFLSVCLSVCLSLCLCLCLSLSLSLTD